MLISFSRQGNVADGSRQGNVADEPKLPVAATVALVRGSEHAPAVAVKPEDAWSSFWRSCRMAEKKTAAARRETSRWSADVTKNSNALDLDRGVFTWKDPAQIAVSLKRSAESSRRRKAGAHRSAISMLTFHINRAGRRLPAAQKKVLEKAKVELRRKFGRE
jgi:Protein of unknown function (DUF3175)